MAGGGKAIQRWWGPAWRGGSQATPAIPVSAGSLVPEQGVSSAVEHTVGSRAVELALGSGSMGGNGEARALWAQALPAWCVPSAPPTACPGDPPDGPLPGQGQSRVPSAWGFSTGMLVTAPSPVFVRLMFVRLLCVSASVSICGFYSVSGLLVSLSSAWVWCHVLLSVFLPLRSEQLLSGEPWLRCLGWGRGRIVGVQLAQVEPPVREGGERETEIWGIPQPRAPRDCAGGWHCWGIGLS